MTSSHSRRMLAVKRVTESRGKRTPAGDTGERADGSAPASATLALVLPRAVDRQPTENRAVDQAMVALDGQTGAALRTHAHSSGCFGGLGVDHRMLQPARQRLCLLKMYAERTRLESVPFEAGDLRNVRPVVDFGLNRNLHADLHRSLHALRLRS